MIISTAKKLPYLILLDIPNAFDTVNQEILLSRLNHYDIRGVAIFSTRLVSRVLQGSILGPILFIYFVNDLSNALKTSPKLFADDTCLLIGDTSLDGLVRFCNSELIHVC